MDSIINKKMEKDPWSAASDGTGHRTASAPRNSSRKEGTSANASPESRATALGRLCVLCDCFAVFAFNQRENAKFAKRNRAEFAKEAELFTWNLSFLTYYGSGRVAEVLKIRKVPTKDVVRQSYKEAAAKASFDRQMLAVTA